MSGIKWMLNRYLKALALGASLVSCSNNQVLSGFPIGKENLNTSFVEGTESISVDGTKYNVEDCSTLQVECRKNDQIGFFLEVLKNCNSDSFVVTPVGKDSRMVLLQVIPHTDSLIYGVRRYSGELSNFGFEISRSQGVVHSYKFSSSDWIDKLTGRISDKRSEVTLNLSHEFMPCR